MVKVNKDVVTTLNNLIHICKDGELGYKKAAEKDREGSLRNLFRQYSDQRSMFVAELRNQVSRLGGKPEEAGTAAGAAHRGWFEAKSALTGADEGAIVSECERGEDTAVRSYRDALKKELPFDVRGLVENQFQKVKEAHDRMRSLELANKQKTSVMQDVDDIGGETEGAPD
ncbi:MAG TPA: PA2169 family four-helix-bundle protein [Candidatus Eisenbacteria bacterium]|jgi:uncharacterized protein (TIGR02284 family)|nr:PA2169 family four-helix-bundle protein [Candidatus Eisenbacteria bacterium]